MSLLYSLWIVLLLLVSMPLWFLIGVCILVTSGLPIFYHQKRIGKGNKPFIIYKFRTMVPGADGLQKELLGKNEANGPVFKIHNDPRYTRIGRFLAHTGLDELPQLWNVMRGEMAIIGPRPFPVSEVSKLTAVQKKRHEIKPGIIAPWIIEGYHRQPFGAWMESDLRYIKHKSFHYDVQLTYKIMILLGKLFIKECTGLTKRR